MCQKGPDTLADRGILHYNSLDMSRLLCFLLLCIVPLSPSDYSHRTWTPFWERWDSYTHWKTVVLFQTCCLWPAAAATAAATKWMNYLETTFNKCEFYQKSPLVWWECPLGETHTHWHMSFSNPVTSAAATNWRDYSFSECGLFSFIICLYDVMDIVLHEYH